MGYIAAVLGRKGQDVTDRLQRMLRATGGSTPSLFGVASPDTGEFFDRSLEPMSCMGSSLIAFKSSIPEDHQRQPILQRSGALAFDGLMFSTLEPDILHVAESLRGDVSEGMRWLLSDERGAFSAAAVDDSMLFLARDVVGTVPLYYGGDNEVMAAASNMKTLTAIGVKSSPVIPGNLMVLSKEGQKKTEAKRFTKQQKTRQDESQCIEALHGLLTEASEDVVRKTRGGVVAFSGGIDSTLTTHYLKEAGGDVDLVCVGVGVQDEYREARRAADALGMDVKIHPFAKQELEDCLNDIVLSVEDANPVKIGVAAPLYFAARQASEDGHSTMFSGNGCDELFGGYHKYMTQWLAEGEKVSDTMYRDVVNSWRDNYERDAKTCKDLGMRLVLPFADARVIEFGLGVPVEYKLPHNMGEPRKIILRRLARELGFPADVVDRPKKAAQYSTGVHRALNGLAKSRGVSLTEYLRRRHEELFDDAPQG